MNRILIWVCLCTLPVACKNSKPAGENIPGVQYRGDTVSVDENSAVNSRIKLYTVAHRDYSAEFDATGIIRVIAGRMAEIAPPFDGRVSRSFVQLGQKVKAGTPVFELHSPEFSEATKNCFQTLQAKKMKEQHLSRQKDLVKNGVGVTKELEEAETEFELALKDYENAVAILAMFNAGPDETAVGQAMKVVSPIAGEVVQTNIVIGQYVKSDASPLAIVAELDKLWVVAQVKEKHINAIHLADRVEIRTDADPGQVVTGHVSHISELLDEETRSVQVLITCDNRDRRLKPGMFASVRFINRPQAALLVPSTALLQNGEQTYVFVRAGEGIYLKKTVAVTTAHAGESVITEGLKAGDEVVAEGGIYLTGN